MEHYNDNTNEIFSLEVDETVKSTFLEMARWTKFLSILGFIFLGLMIMAGVLVGMFAGSLPDNNPLSAMGAAGIILYFLFIAGISLYPILTLYKYSTGIKTAIRTNDKNEFNKAITNLKNTFKFYGILMIIMLALYGVILIAAMFIGMMKR